jgi:integrase
MSDQTVSKRSTAWVRDKRQAGIYSRYDGRSHGYYDRQLGRVVALEGGRQAALDAKAKADLRKSAKQPTPDTKVRICDLAEEVREAKRRRLRDSSFAAFEYALDKIILPELGHLKPGQCGPDRIARLVRDLEDRGLGPATIRRYLTALSAIFQLAIRRGAATTSPLTLLSDDEKPTGGGVAAHYEWTVQEINNLIEASEKLAEKPEARYDYSSLIRVLVTLGLRVGEVLALRKADVDLLSDRLHVRHSGGRNGAELGETKTDAGARTVPLSPGMVDLFVRLVPVDAPDDAFIFSTTDGKTPISYWNFRKRGFLPARKAAGLSETVTIHTLRSAAISLYAARGLTLNEVAEVMGQSDPLTTWRHYLRLFDRSKVAERIREAQSSLD